jgi:hypothetical protein
MLHFKNLPKNKVFIMYLKHWLQCLMNVFEYFILIRSIPNHITCFHNILEILYHVNINNLQH